MADKTIGGCVRTPCPDAFCRNDWTRTLYWLRSCVHPFGNYVDHQGREASTDTRDGKPSSQKCKEREEREEFEDLHTWINPCFLLFSSPFTLNRLPTHMLPQSPSCCIIGLRNQPPDQPNMWVWKKYFPELEPIYGQAQQSPSLIYEFILLPQSYRFVGLAHTYCGVISYVVNLSL